MAVAVVGVRVRLWCFSSDPNSDLRRRGFGIRSDPQAAANNKKKKKNKNNKNDENTPNNNTLQKPYSNSGKASTINEAPGLSSGSGIKLGSTFRDLQFEEKLASIRRSAVEQKKFDEIKEYGEIDYDQVAETEPSTTGLGVKIGIGIAVVIFGLVFALGDFLPTMSDDPREEATVVDSKLTEEEKKTLQTRLQQFEEQLIASPRNPVIVEGAAVTLMELGEYSQAATLLEDLTKMKPNDPDAFRLRGEVQYQLKDYEGSAASYKRSAMVSKTVNFEVLRGLSNALLSAKKPDEAVHLLLVFRERLNANKLADSSTLDAEVEVVDPVQVELLLGKAYSDWGHVSDAVSVYDQLISNHPDDFRAYLAKGIILKENGRAGDAERMFIQARFFAPEKAKALVDRFSRK